MVGTVTVRKARLSPLRMLGKLMDSVGETANTPHCQCGDNGFNSRTECQIPSHSGIGRRMKLTNNIGCMSKSEIENFAAMVLRECCYDYTMKWTIAGDILIGEIIYIDERHINEYPYMAKERVLHEVAHIDTWPEDDRHGEIFHTRLAELIEQFMGCESLAIEYGRPECAKRQVHGKLHIC